MTVAIKFTGLEIEATSLKASRMVKYDYVPAGWTTCCFEVEPMWNSRFGTTDSNLINWILEHMTGRFGIFHKEPPRVVVYFEDEQDAILFRILEGDKAWTQTQS